MLDGGVIELQEGHNVATEDQIRAALPELVDPRPLSTAFEAEYDALSERLYARLEAVGALLLRTGARGKALARLEAHLEAALVNLRRALEAPLRFAVLQRPWAALHGSGFEPVAVRRRHLVRAMISNT